MILPSQIIAYFPSHITSAIIAISFLGFLNLNFLYSILNDSLCMKNKSAKKKGKKKRSRGKREKRNKHKQTKKVVFAKKENKAWFRHRSTPNLTDCNQSYPLLHSNHLESSILVQRYGIGPRPFSLSLHEIDVRIDTQ